MQSYPLGLCYGTRKTKTLSFGHATNILQRLGSRVSRKTVVVINELIKHVINISIHVFFRNSVVQ